MAGAAGQGFESAPDSLRIDLAFIGECQQQGLVAGYMLQHPDEEARLARCGAQRLGPEPGQRQKALEPLGLGGEEAQRRDGKRGRGLLAGLGGRLAGVRYSAAFSLCSPKRGKVPAGTLRRGPPWRSSLWFDLRPRRR